MASFLSGILLWLAPASIGSFFSGNVRLWLWLVVVLSTFVIPVIGLIIMKLTSSISDFQLPDREQRVVPFFFIAVFYGIAAYLIVSRLNISGTVNVIFLATTFLVLMSAFITIFWKISIHSMGMAGVVGFLLALNLKMPDSIPVWVVILWVLCTGITMTSRLYLNAHHPKEVYVGAIFGFVSSYLAIYIFV
jgi:membrane-associated phospholipid phosphatase